MHNQINQQDAEVGLLAGLLLDPREIAKVETTILATDFDDKNHSEFFAILVNMNAAGESIRDVRLVMSRLKAAGVLDGLGGPIAFQDAFLNQHAIENVQTYAEQVRRNAVHHDTVQMADGLSSMVRSANDTADTLAWLRSQIESIESRAVNCDHTVTIGQACEELLTDIRETLKTGETPTIPTGIEAFDDAYGGLLPSKLYVIAARPGVGKSSWSQQAGENIAESNRAALFVSLEMSRAEVATRYLAKRTGLNGKFIASHVCDERELSKLDEAVECCRSIPFLISEPSASRSTTDAICAEARLQHATHGLSVLIIDYLQIVEPDNPKQHEVEKITKATRAYKQLSRELKIPVVLLSQLNRSGEKEKVIREPRLSDLRGCGSIEQDADAVIFLHSLAADRIELIVAKMRGGGLHRQTMVFDGPSCSFRSEEASDQDNFNDEFVEFA